MSFYIFIPLAVIVSQSHAQLVGSRGVVSLPEGFVYHDNETLDASKRAAEYARTFQVVEDHQVAQQKLIILQKDHLSKEAEPKYANSLNKVGRKIALNSVLSFENSRLFNPPVENRLNVPLEEVEKERENGKIRLLPGQGVIPSQRYAAKTPGRFDSADTEESERAKNAGETVFDDGPNETKLKYQYKGRPVLGEYYDKYFGKTKHDHKKSPIETPKSSPSFLTAYSPHLAAPKNTPVTTASPLYPPAPIFNPSYNIHPPHGHYSYLVNHRG